MFYNARMAQRAADAELSEARRGIDETEPSAATKIEAIRDGLHRGLSPEQIAATRPELGLAASTIYRWVDAGYAEMTNMELRRKVGYRPRRKSAPAGAGRHSQRRSHAEFGALPGDARADEGEIAELIGERPGETRLFYCDPRRADQKGGCERNHMEIRKLLPKGNGVSFDRLDRADAALVMSQVNSEPRGRLAWRSPAEMLLAALGGDARALMLFQ